MTEPATLPYGTWPSPISAADVASGHALAWSFPASCRLPDDPDHEVWWLEGRPTGRWTLRAGSPRGRRRGHRRARSGVERPQPDHRVRRAPVDPRGPRGGTVFCFWDDQRLYLLPDGAHEPRPLTTAPTDDSHAHVRRATARACRHSARGARDAHRRRREPRAGHGAARRVRRRRRRAGHRRQRPAPLLRAPAAVAGRHAASPTSRGTTRRCRGTERSRPSSSSAGSSRRPSACCSDRRRVGDAAGVGRRRSPLPGQRPQRLVEPLPARPSPTSRSTHWRPVRRSSPAHCGCSASRRTGYSPMDGSRSRTDAATSSSPCSTRRPDPWSRAGWTTHGTPTS